MAFKPTLAQTNAINVGSGALVCAAAGSGKTAVLAERVTKLLTSENHIEADRILVVTFMSAAAEEMRQRIEKKLNQEFAKNPNNKFLYSQKLKLRNAKICTIDSFCIELVRENFDVFGISPDFKVGNDASVDKISDKVLGDILNREFENATPEFLALLNALCSKFDETDLKDAIVELYGFSQNLPFPQIWYENLYNSLGTDEYKSEIISAALNKVKRTLDMAIFKIQMALSAVAKDVDLEEKLNHVLSDDKSLYEGLYKLAESFDWNGLYLALNQLSFKRWPSIKNMECYALTAARNLRDDAKEMVTSLRKLVENTDSVVLSDMDNALSLVRKLIELSKEYSDKFIAECRKENTLTFSQAEHYALDLLCKNIDNQIVKTELAEDIISRFDEVLVDEFQDINDMQDLLFNILSKDEQNLFVVGDVKQSIYGFRGSNPDNFLSKKNKYLPFESYDSSSLQKIVLGNNFRSRKGVCDSINYLFSLVMNGEKSDIEYNEEEILIPTAEFPPIESPDSEVHFIDLGTREDSAAIIEAQYIADYINSYMEKGSVTGEDNGARILRKPEFSDFALILRTVSAKGNIYAEVLRKNNIPVKFSADAAFDSAEVKILLSLLTAVSNPSRDIELASVMMSPLFSFTANEMAEIRCIAKNVPLISAVTASANAGNKKAAEFLKKLTGYRTAAVSLGIGDLTDYLLDATNLLNIVSALPEGKMRSDNLMQFYAKAVEYQQNNISKNILRFVDYIRGLTDAEASNSSKENAVTITTIHKSKGLQYPVCIIGDTNKYFSAQDKRKNLLNDVRFGVGFKYFDINLNEKKSSLQFEMIKDKIFENAYREEMRLLYVALTRAQDKLVIVNTVSKLEERFIDAAAISSTCDNIEQYIRFVSESKSYFDWLVKASVIHPDFKLQSFESRLIAETESNIKFVKENAENIVVSAADEAEEEIFAPDFELAERIKNNIREKYPFAAVKEIETKSSVAVVAHKADENDYSFTATPDFMSASGLSPAKRGTATHRFMQFCDFVNAEKSVKDELDRLYEWEFITENEHDAVDIVSVQKFFGSDIYKRIKKSPLVKREMRFITEMPAGRFNSALPESVANEPIIIQGSVDLVFEENGKLIILDFKTDRITDEEKLIKAYAEQLNIYAAACEKILEKPIGECLLYSFGLGKTVKI